MKIRTLLPKLSWK